MIGRIDAKSHKLFGFKFVHRGGSCLGMQFGAGSKLSGQSRLAGNEVACLPLIRANILGSGQWTTQWLYPFSTRKSQSTFYYGPVPRYSNQILDILAAQCVKATFLLIGEMARAHPSTARWISLKVIPSAPTAKIILCHRHPQRRSSCALWQIIDSTS